MYNHEWSFYLPMERILVWGDHPLGHHRIWMDHIGEVSPGDCGQIEHTNTWTKHIWLVVSTPLKHMKVNGKDYPIYEMENKKCLKPPTRHVDVNICEHTQQKKDF